MVVNSYMSGIIDITGRVFAEWANNIGIQFESTSLSPMSCVYHAAHTYMHAHTYVRGSPHLPHLLWNAAHHFW